jgi:hypothetical protein
VELQEAQCRGLVAAAVVGPVLGSQKAELVRRGFVVAPWAYELRAPLNGN